FELAQRDLRIVEICPDEVKDASTDHRIADVFAHRAGELAGYLRAARLDLYIRADKLILHFSGIRHILDVALPEPERRPYPGVHAVSGWKLRANPVDL